MKYLEDLLPAVDRGFVYDPESFTHLDPALLADALDPGLHGTPEELKESIVNLPALPRYVSTDDSSL